MTPQRIVGAVSICIALTSAAIVAYILCNSMLGVVCECGLFVSAMLYGVAVTFKEQQQFYVVLQYNPTTALFEFNGVFSSHAKAIAACRDWAYSVNGPVELDHSQPHETTHDTMECFYPKE